MFEILIKSNESQFLYRKNFLLTGRTNSRIKQDLESIEDAIEHLNQTMHFLLQSIQYVTNCRDSLVDSPILIVFLLWRLSIYQADCNILQN